MTRVSPDTEQGKTIILTPCLCYGRAERTSLEILTLMFLLVLLYLYVYIVTGILVIDLMPLSFSEGAL